MDIIWERRIDPAHQAARWRRFLTWFPLPALALITTVGITSGLEGALGALIVAGLAGVLLVGYIVFKGLALKMSPPVGRDGDEIVSGVYRMAIDQMTHWTTYIWTVAEQRQDRRVDPRGPFFDVGILRFTMVDGREVEITWPELTQAEIDELRDTLAPHLTAPWVPRPDPRG